MTETTQWLLVIAGVLAIGGLLMLIRAQLGQQRAQQRAQQERLTALQAEAQKQRDYLEDSVRVIAGAIRDEQCEVVEGCIRLKKLLDHLAPYLHEHETLGVFNQVYELTKHMPILDEWKQLKLRQRVAYMQEMEVVEKEHRIAVMAAATELLAYRFRQ